MPFRGGRRFPRLRRRSGDRFPVSNYSDRTSRYHHQLHQQQIQQQQQQQLEQLAVQQPKPEDLLPPDPSLLFAEDFRARSQKRRAIVSKALGIRHPDLLHFCIHSPLELVRIRARSNRYQSSLLAHRRAKLEKQKLKEKKKGLVGGGLTTISSQPPTSAQASNGEKGSTPAHVQFDSATTDRATKKEHETDNIGSGSGDFASGSNEQPKNNEKLDSENQLNNDGTNDGNVAKDDDQAPASQSSLSGGPQNDYSYHFICTGERPANFVRDVGLANRFEEYPKLRDLIRAKDALIQSTNTPPFYLKADLSTFNLTDFGTDFDCVLIEPPIEEYQFMGQTFDRYWTWNEIEALNIGAITAPRSFIWLWVGAGEGLDRGRRCLSKWGFRRCEDICWVKTNINRPGPSSVIEPRSLFQRTKEHCLMGIKGTVLRSKDGDFIHANIDLDVIIEEEPEPGVKEKPIEMFHMIEHFCLGRRRLHLFARESTIRPGWVSVGSELIRSNYDAEAYRQAIAGGSGLTTGCTEEIERMRPKTPPAVKAAVAAQAAQAQQAQAATAATAAALTAGSGPPGSMVAPLTAAVIQPSPMAPAMLASTFGAALLQQHSDSPSQVSGFN